ncbi:MAG: threonine/serine exporter family protein [Eubacteriales bacterium]|nr:threonine/serine exporter family protein [Eubacteriales bacterium]
MSTEIFTSQSRPAGLADAAELTDTAGDPARACREREILLLALQAGRILLENGAEIFRVEDTVYRICRFYGLKSASAFVVSNAIFLTSGNEEEAQFAKVQQIPVNVANLSRVAQVNQLSRQIEAGRRSLAEVRRELTRIEHTPGFSVPQQVAAASIAGACFSFMFGGGILDFACSLLIGALLQLYMARIGKPNFSKIVCNILGSGWVTFLSLLCHRLLPGTHLESMMIGGIILMVPGVAFTNAIRDFADGDYISGSVRMLDALLVFFCIAMGVGFMIAVWNRLMGGVLL